VAAAPVKPPPIAPPVPPITAPTEEAAGLFDLPASDLVSF